jgi:hypothetical protein
MTSKLPSITLAQATAVFGWIVAQAVAYGWLDSLKSQLALSAGSTILAAAWKFADAWIRSSRNNVRAASIAAGKGDPANS